MKAGLALLAAIGCDHAATAPRVTGAMPDHGPLVGGTRITLEGEGFTSRIDRVLIGGREAPLSAALDDRHVEVVIPPGDRPGDAEVLVLDATANARATGVFHYSTPPVITSAAPSDVVFTSTSTTVTLTGAGFLDEDAGDVAIAVDGVLATDVAVASDTELTFTAPPGHALSRPTIELVDTRGTATRPRAFRYTPKASRGLLLFPSFGPQFAVFFDPADHTTVDIPAIPVNRTRYTTVVRDAAGEYWAFDRSSRFGRIDMTTQTLIDPVITQRWIPTMARAGDFNVALDRAALQFGTLDADTGAFTPLPTPQAPCCGSYGLAWDGTTLYFTGRQGAAVFVNTLDPVSGAQGTPVALTANLNFHVEEMRSFDGVLYATSRDSTLATIDPATGVVTVLATLGRFNAMETFE